MSACGLFKSLESILIRTVKWDQKSVFYFEFCLVAILYDDVANYLGWNIQGAAAEGALNIQIHSYSNFHSENNLIRLNRGEMVEFPTY